MSGRIRVAIAQRGLGSSLQISLGLLVLAAALPGIRIFADIHQAGSQKQREWRELDQRWTTLIAQRSNLDSSKWVALEDDLRGFARKFDIHLEEHATRNNPQGKKTASAEFAQCLPRDDVRNYRCNLFPGPKGVCRYVCIPLDSQPRSDRK